jgi:hypothetical protein
MMDAAYSSCSHNNKIGVFCAAEIVDIEILWAFVEAKMKVNADDATLQVIPMQQTARQCK